MRRGFTIAVLKESGKVPSVIQKLIKVVIGRRRESMQDLRSVVGIRSREQVEFEEERIALGISSGVVIEKLARRGGEIGGETL